MAKLLYKLTVEMNMGLEMAADALHADETYMRRLRANSVKNVKATNGLLSLKDRMTDVEDEVNDAYDNSYDDSYGDSSQNSYDDSYGYDYDYGGDEWRR